jgi:hypothetical protein
MELGREILPELAASLMRATTSDGREVAMDPAMLQSSRVLRKLASPDGSVRLSDAATVLACERAALLPSSLGDFGPWLDALDYLCAEPPPELYLGAVARAFRHLLSRRRVENGDTEANSTIIAQRRFLAASFSQGAAVAGAAGPSSPPRGTKRQRRSLSAAAPEPGAAGAANSDALRTLEAAEEALAVSIQFEATRASPFWGHARRLVRCALLGLADTPAGALQVCSYLQRLVTLLSAAQLRWLVHRALHLLHSAERAGENVFLDLHEVRELQHAYKLSYLDLASLLPLGKLPATRRAPPLFLLPRCAGRAQVPPVPSDALHARRACERRVPWLRLLWEKGAQEGVAFYLTGSTLTAALFPRAGLLVEPGDVDIFVLNQPALERAVALLATCVDGAAPDGRLAESRKVNSHKYRIKLFWQGRETGVDLYAHPLARIHRYHMSAARIAFDGSRLYCSATGAVALATSVSTCFEMAPRAEKAAAILLRRWRAGASLLVNEEELRAFVDFSQTGEAALTLEEKRALGKFRSIAARDGLALHLRYSEAQRETALGDYNEWRLPAPSLRQGLEGEA